MSFTGLYQRRDKKENNNNKSRMTTIKKCMLMFMAVMMMIMIKTCHSWMMLPAREVLQNAMSIATMTGMLMSPTTTISNADTQFAGSYIDPNHANCQRVIVTPTSKEAILYGTDGNPNCPADGSGASWELVGTVDGNKISVDFSPKGGPKGLIGIYDTDGIKWPDGNKWTKKSQ